MKFRRFYGKVKGGSLVFSMENIARWKELLQMIEAGSGEFELEIKQREYRPTSSQFGYLYGGIYREALRSNKFASWTEDQMEHFFGDMFLAERITIELPGKPVEVKRVIRSTASLTRRELSEFIEKVIAWLANEGIVVSGPEDYYPK